MASRLCLISGAHHSPLAVGRESEAHPAFDNWIRLDLCRNIFAFVPGGTFFFTVTLRERRRKVLTGNLDHLREVFRAARRLRPFSIEAIVILPDHLHLDLAFRGVDFSSRCQDIKARFAS